MSEASARTLLENLETDTLAAVIDNLSMAAVSVMDGDHEPDSMLCQDLNDLLKIATDIYCQRIKEAR